MESELSKIITLMLSKQAPKAIFLLSHATTLYKHDNLFCNNIETAEQPSAYLLFLVIDTDKKTCTEIQSNLENLLQHLASLTCWCMPLSSFNEELSKGNYFITKVFTKAPRLFIAEDAVFAAPGASSENYYQSHWYQRALEFFAGAELYAIRKQYAIAAFQLHQCAEQAFTGIIYNTCGYRPSTHNLLLLHKYACWFKPSLHHLFPNHTNGEESLLQLLQRSYKESRYTNDYSIKGKQLEILKTKIQQLLQEAKMQ